MKDSSSSSIKNDNIHDLNHILLIDNIDITNKLCKFNKNCFKINCKLYHETPLCNFYSDCDNYYCINRHSRFRKNKCIKHSCLMKSCELLHPNIKKTFKTIIWPQCINKIIELNTKKGDTEYMIVSSSINNNETTIVIQGKFCKKIMKKFTLSLYKGYINEFILSNDKKVIPDIVYICAKKLQYGYCEIKNHKIMLYCKFKDQGLSFEKKFINNGLLLSNPFYGNTNFDNEVKYSQKKTKKQKQLAFNKENTCLYIDIEISFLKYIWLINNKPLHNIDLNIYFGSYDKIPQKYFIRISYDDKYISLPIEDIKRNINNIINQIEYKYINILNLPDIYKDIFNIKIIHQNIYIKPINDLALKYKCYCNIIKDNFIIIGYLKDIELFYSTLISKHFQQLHFSKDIIPFNYNKIKDKNSYLKLQNKYNIDITCIVSENKMEIRGLTENIKLFLNELDNLISS